MKKAGKMESKSQRYVQTNRETPDYEEMKGSANRRENPHSIFGNGDGRILWDVACRRGQEGASGRTSTVRLSSPSLGDSLFGVFSQL